MTQISREDLEQAVRDAAIGVSFAQFSLDEANQELFDARCALHNIHIGDIVRSERLGNEYVVENIERWPESPNQKPRLIGRPINKPFAKAVDLYDKWELIRKSSNDQPVSRP